MSAAKKEIQQEYFSTGQIARIVGMSTQTIRREIRAGKLRAEIFNGNMLIKKSDFDEWKARNFKPYVQS